MKKTIVMILALTVGMTVKAQTLQISDEDELKDFRTAVNNGTLEYSTIELTADIALTADWFPIGTLWHPFTATFDGKGHTISNINMQPEASGESGTGNVSGFFGYISGGTVRNLIVNNTNQDHYIGINNPESGTNIFVGAIAGLNCGTIERCANRDVKVCSYYDHAGIGGIAGENGIDWPTGPDEEGTINNCYNLGEVFAGQRRDDNWLGGITGNNLKGSVNNCFVRATIATDLLAGCSFWGWIVADRKTGSITNCYYMENVRDLIIINNNSDNSFSDGTADVILEGHTLYKDNHWNTLCLPFNVTDHNETDELTFSGTILEGAIVKELSSASFDSSNGELTLNFSDDLTAITAGKPYIVKWASGYDVTIPAFENVYVSSLSLQDVTKDLGSGMSITFKGCFSPVSVSGPSYLFLSSNDELYYPSSARTIGSCRAYFELSGLTAGDTENGEPDPVSGARSIRAFSLNFNDESTGIVEMRKEEGAGNHVNASLPEYFTINGVKLTGKPTAKGLYIRSTPASQQGKKDSRIIMIK